MGSCLCELTRLTSLCYLLRKEKTSHCMLRRYNGTIGGCRTSTLPTSQTRPLPSPAGGWGERKQPAESLGRACEAISCHLLHHSQGSSQPGGKRIAPTLKSRAGPLPHNWIANCPKPTTMLAATRPQEVPPEDSPHPLGCPGSNRPHTLQGKDNLFPHIPTPVRPRAGRSKEQKPQQVNRETHTHTTTHFSVI